MIGVFAVIHKVRPRTAQSCSCSRSLRFSV